MHQKGDYAKGKGRSEFIVWLQEHHGTAIYIPFERADGGHQDLDFNGALPVYKNRKLMLAFPKTLIFELDHSYIFENVFAGRGAQQTNSYLHTRVQVDLITRFTPSALSRS
eukprot:6208149-Pleurochrysis_carterae.AAC.2